MTDILRNVSEIVVHFQNPNIYGNTIVTDGKTEVIIPLFFNFYLFIFFLRESAHKSGRGRERETESQADSTLPAQREPSAGLEFMSLKIMT